MSSGGGGGSEASSYDGGYEISSDGGHGWGGDN